MRYCELNFYVCSSYLFFMDVYLPSHHIPYNCYITLVSLEPRFVRSRGAGWGVSSDKLITFVCVCACRGSHMFSFMPYGTFNTRDDLTSRYKFKYFYTVLYSRETPHC